MQVLPSTYRRLRLARAVSAALLAVAMLTSFTASASARSPVLKMIWGPDYLQTIRTPLGLLINQSAFPTYQRLGVNVFETELLWNETAPTRPSHPTNPNDPAYQWPAEVTDAVSQAAHYGIQVCILVQWSPSWASGQSAPQWAPRRARDFGNFLAAAARRYPSVHYWMIWGEPTRPGNFLPMPTGSAVGPRRYALLLNAAYHALKRVSRSNMVIGGDTTSVGQVMPPGFIKYMRLPNGKPPPLDYYGHNPYGTRYPQAGAPTMYPGAYPGTRDIDGLGALHRQLDHTYHRNVRLWLSEFGINDAPNAAFGFFTSLTGQAQWVTAAYNLVNSLHYVVGLGWYDLVDEPPTVPLGLSMGLMSWNLVPKPSFYAYANAP